MERQLLYDIIEDAMSIANRAFRHTEVSMDEEAVLAEIGIDLQVRVDELWREGFDASYEIDGTQFQIEPLDVPVFRLTCGPYVIRIEAGFSDYGRYDVENKDSLSGDELEMVNKVLGEMFG